MITEDELKEIELRWKATSKGNWISFIEGRDHESGSDFIMTGVLDKNDFNNKNRGEDIELIGATSNDQDFIANSRQDIPKLIAEIRRLRKNG